MRCGGTPNLAFTPSTSSTLRRLGHGVDQRHLGVTSCARSLSPVEISTLWPLAAAMARQRADGVVGLDARHFEHRPAEQAHGLVDRLDLLRQRLGHRRALRLVLGVPVVAEGRPLGVEDTHRVLGRVALAQPLHHRQHAVDRAGGKAVRAAQVGQRVVGAVQVAGAVDQQHDLVAHGPIVGQPRGAPAARLSSAAAAPPPRGRP